MMRNQMIRYFHSGASCWTTSVSKSQLAKLRKKTGYTFSNCKKALEVNENNFEKAERWLQDQAQALGWSKLSKLEGRRTAQGLVGIAISGKRAAMVEVNCETDFVARNKSFKEIINLVANACLQHTQRSDKAADIPILKETLDGEHLKSLPGLDGKALADHIALLVSSVGENVSLKRGICVGVKDDLFLAGYAHPGSSEEEEGGGVMSGKYGALLVYGATASTLATGQAGRQLCQHVVGMNPKTIKKPEPESAEKEKVREEAEGSREAGRREEETEETAMLSQDFLLDPSLTVGELASENGITIRDFVRFETGERVAEEDSPEKERLAQQTSG